MGIATRTIGSRSVLAALVAWLLFISQFALAQGPVWNAPVYGGIAAPAPVAAAYGAYSYGNYAASPSAAAGYAQNSFAQNAYAPSVAGGPNHLAGYPAQANPLAAAPPRTTGVPSRPPIARLVRNANTSDGSPPFALADQNGKIQRLVEPVPGVDLESHLGEIVAVRHDTGRTILATQLELPTRPLLPMPGQGTAASESRSVAASTAQRAVKTARFIDDDDTTVQLVYDDTMPSRADTDGQERSAIVKSSPSDSHEELPHGMTSLKSSIGGGEFEQMSSGPMFPDNYIGDEISGDIEFGDCPNCGRRHGTMGCDAPYGPDDMSGRIMGKSGILQGRMYGDVQLNFMRLHLMEGSVGKLGERYELSPRFTLGFDGNGSLGFRSRFWLYDRETPILGGGGIDVSMHVLDLEATQRFHVGSTDLTAAAGFRWAGVSIEDADGDGVGADLLGLTFALDGHTPVCEFQGGQLAWVYGGRLAILGGDWDGSSNNDLVPGSLQDDNVIAESIFVGVQYGFNSRDCRVVGRLAFEMQNWHSDVLSQNAGADSLGFLGPGVHIGATF